MIQLPEIPVEISPARLANELGLPTTEINSFLDEVHGLLKPAGVFDEVDPKTVLGPLRGDAHQDWASSVIIGLCTMGARVAREVSRPDQGSVLWFGLSRLALRDALDYLEYRVRLFLRPAGREPSTCLVPGCQDLPLPANQAILGHFSPKDSLGLTIDPGGEIDSRVGLAFVYTTAIQPEESASRYAACSRKDCPARL